MPRRSRFTRLRNSRNGNQVSGIEGKIAVAMLKVQEKLEKLDKMYINFMKNRAFLD